MSHTDSSLMRELESSSIEIIRLAQKHKKKKKKERSSFGLHKNHTVRSANLDLGLI